ncbi:hypothetical protein Tco_1123888 [Tanacetum coccineum]|uniref:Uncharacterized protein n=1 Tax=Tanacetum coccineum TaxID=301880 RepID=A0ABQ5J7L7_9ASTR
MLLKLRANTKIIVPLINRLKVEYWDDVEDLIKDDEIEIDMESGAFTPDMEAIVKAEQESSQCRDFVFRAVLDSKEIKERSTAKGIMVKGYIIGYVWYVAMVSWLDDGGGDGDGDGDGDGVGNLVDNDTAL